MRECKGKNKYAYQYDNTEEKTYKNIINRALLKDILRSCCDIMGVLHG